jgi:hypothetical protein
MRINKIYELAEMPRFERTRIRIYAQVDQEGTSKGFIERLLHVMCQVHPIESVEAEYSQVGERSQEERNA